MMDSSMGLGLAGPPLSRFSGWNHFQIGWHTAVQVKSWSQRPLSSYQRAQKSWIEKAWQLFFVSPTFPCGLLRTHDSRED